MKLKLIIDYNPLSDFEGSAFYFNSWAKLFDFIEMAAEDSYHTYFIDDLETGQKD